MIDILDYLWYCFKVIMFLAILGCVGMLFRIIVLTGPGHNPEQIRHLANGKLINIRATGDWGIYNTELKFEDGSMLVVTYSFTRQHNLREGQKYKIWKSSKYGYRCKLLEE